MQSTFVVWILGIILGGVWLFFWMTMCMYVAAAMYKINFIRSKTLGKLSVYMVIIPFFLMSGSIVAFWLHLVFVVFPMSYSWEWASALSAGAIIFFIWCLHRMEITKKPLWLPWPLKLLLVKFLDEVYGRDYHGLT